MSVNVKSLDEILRDQGPDASWDKVLSKDEQKTIYDNGTIVLDDGSSEGYEVDLETIKDAEIPKAELGDWLLHISAKNWATSSHIAKIVYGYRFYALLEKFNPYNGKSE